MLVHVVQLLVVDAVPIATYTSVSVTPTLPDREERIQGGSKERGRGSRPGELSRAKLRLALVAGGDHP